MNRLLELSEEFNIKQNGFKDLFGYTKDVIYNIQNERTAIDHVKLINFCKLFQVTPDYFLGLSNEGIYVNVLNRVFILSKEKFLLYKSAGKIFYVDGVRMLDVNSLSEIEIVEGSTPLIKLKNEIL